METPRSRDPTEQATRRVLDAVALAVIVTDASGIVTAWNRSAELLFGWLATEAFGQPMTDLIVPADACEESAEIIASITRGVARSGEFQCRHKDGTKIWTATTLSPMIDNGEVVAFVASSVDVSERRAEEIRLSSLVHRATDVAMILDADGTFKYLSPSVERAFGYQPGPHIGEDAYHLVHPDDRAMVAGAITAAAEDPTAHPMVVYRVRAGDGSWRWAELVASSMLDEPAVAGIVVNVRDVTEREHAIAELRSSEARFRSLFEHANDVGFLTDADGIVRYITPSLQDVLGYEPEDIVGRASWTAFAVETIEISTKAIIAALATPGSRIDFTATLLAADGTQRWVEFTVRNLLDDDAVKGFVTNLRDVTDRMQALSALRISEAKQRAIVARSNELTMFFEQDGTIAWVSPAAAEVFDMDPQNLVGRFGFDMVHPDDLDRLVQEFMIPNLGDHVRAEFRVIDDSGRIRWVEEVVTNRFDDPDVGYAVANLREVTAQHAAAEALEASEARYRSIVETAQEGIWVTALDGSTVFANATMAEMLGCDIAVLEAGSLQEFLSSGARQTVDALDRAAGDGEAARGEALFARDGQSDLWAIVSTSPLRNRGGEVDGYLHMITDITERKEMEDELTRIAIHDPLTRLPNRGLLVNRLERSLARRSGLPTAVICLDLDNFKDINDSLGSAEGDEVLIAVGERLRRAARAEDTVSRFDGDEYVVLCEEVADASEAVALAEVLHAAVRAPLKIGPTEVVISASIGVALSPPAEPTAVLRCADTAMYRAKRQGRGRITLFDEAPNHAAQKRLSTQFELLRALENDELVVWYQPIVDLQRGRVDAVEALVRWRHPERGLILPGEFIPVAEASGLVREVGWRVLEIACRDATSWYAENNQLRLSVNLAAAQLSDDSLLPRIRAVLASNGLPPDALTLELTESAAMHDEVAIAQQLRNLRDMGVHLALDDFGTGYSSLSLLRRLPINAVKIDRSFVSGLGVSRDDTLIVGGVISMARAMGHAVVAEGIETEAQRDEVTRLGCRYGQGYLFSRAVPIYELPAAITGINHGTPGLWAQATLKP